MKRAIYLLTLTVLTAALTGCGGRTRATAERAGDTLAMTPCPTFQADSALDCIKAQCAFGPRVTGSAASKACGDWIVAEFTRRGCTVEEQKGEVTTWDGTKLTARNITARYRPEAKRRLMLCAHWDSRPWADNDDDETKHHTPVTAANDGASGVAVMLEIARLLHETGDLGCGVDFVCFDAEDMGTPQWADGDSDRETSTWCLGSQMWSERMKGEKEKPVFAILLDMVGGYGATFSKESTSVRYAGDVVDEIWRTAGQIGYGHFFPVRDGGGVEDDHVYVNRAGIPCVDIIPYHEYGPSVFGPTWHTAGDTPERISTQVLEAVGQTVLQVLYNRQ